jgi:sugar phosphate permease
MLCLPVSVIFSSPLSGWILGRWNWRVLLISEGALPFLWLFVWWYFISDHPHQARWISAEERDYLERTLRSESSELEPSPLEPYLSTLLRYLRALLSSHVLLMVGIYFLVNSGNYGYLFWLPSALQKAKAMSYVQIGFLNSVPYILTAIGMVLISRHSDRTRERPAHVAFALAWGGVLLLSSVLASNQASTSSYGLIALVGAGSYGVLGPFWAIPTETLPRSVAGSAMGLINALGNLGGYFGPLAVGYLNQRAGNFLLAFGVLSAGFLTASALSLLLPRPHGSVRPIIERS